VGIDKIKLKLDDRTVHPLIEVQYVPDLIKNLTSVDSLQFKCNIGGVLEVVRVTRQSNLYFKGSTIIDEASTCYK